MSSFNHGASSSFTNSDNTQQGQQTPGYSNYNAGDATSSQAKAFDAWANYLINKFKNGGDINTGTGSSSTSPMTPTGGFTWKDGGFTPHEPRPIILTTPAVDPKPDILITPIPDKELPRDGGFTPHEPRIEDYTESFPIHVPKLEDYISFNKVWDAPEVKEQLPIGSIDLDNHEGGAHNGHAVERHVDKDKVYLDKRIQDAQKRFPGRNFKATSYPDKATAEKVIGEIVDDKAQGIADWLNSAPVGDSKAFTLDLGREIGYGMQKGDTDVSPRTKAAVVLKKMADDSIKIVTSYPIS